MALSKILGIDKNLFIVLAVLIVLLAIFVLFIYFGTVFVDKNEAKIVSGLKKETKVLNKGWHLIFPIRDKVIATLPLGEQMFDNTKQVSLVAKDEKYYSIFYSVTFKVINPLDFYNKANISNSVVENYTSKALVVHYASVSLNNPSNIYTEITPEFIASLNRDVKKIGVEVTDLTITSVSK